jgi:hypothetical protein
MRELKAEIERITLPDFKDPPEAYRRCPHIMNLMLSGEPTTYSAKEYVLNKQNTLSIYEIHVVNALERLELVA